MLLEKSMRWQRENLLMIERLGVNTDWAEKSKLAYAKLLKLLEPKLPGAPGGCPLRLPRRPRKPPVAVPPPTPPGPAASWRGAGWNAARGFRRGGATGVVVLAVFGV